MVRRLKAQNIINNNKNTIIVFVPLCLYFLKPSTRRTRLFI